MLNKIIFRCDASHNRIGLGHLMRCLSLARVLKRSDTDIHFICNQQSKEFENLIINEGFKVSFICGDYHGLILTNISNSSLEFWECDSEKSLSIIKKNQPSWLIVDHYELDARWESIMKPHCDNIMVIDDMANREHNCDVLLDQNLVANMHERYNGLIPNNCIKFFGPKYALLHDQYSKYHSKSNTRTLPIKRIFAYFGAADAGCMEKFINAYLMLNRNDIFVDIVIHKNNDFKDDILKKIRDKDYIKAYSEQDTLVNLILKADLAVGSGGVSSLERCCLGLPSLVVSLAENQIESVKELHRRNTIVWVGHKDEVSVNSLYRCIKSALENNELEQMSKMCLDIVDGNGSERLADYILSN